MNPSLVCASCLLTLGTGVMSEHHSWNGSFHIWPPPLENAVPGALLDCHTATSLAGSSLGSMGTLLSPSLSRAWQGTSPGGPRAQQQLPEDLPEEPGREAAAVAALAQVTEVAGELAQEQCLGLGQGWGGQQGSGSLATLLQAWGLCSRKKNGQSGRSGASPASHGSSAPTSTQGMSCGSSLLLLETQQNLTSTSPNTIRLQPIPSQMGHRGYPRVCRDYFFRVLATSFWGLPAPFTNSHHPRSGCQVPVAHSFCQHIQGKAAQRAELLTWSGLHLKIPHCCLNGKYSMVHSKAIIKAEVGKWAPA